MIAHFNSLSMGAIERRGGRRHGRGGGGVRWLRPKSGKEQSARLKSARLSPLDSHYFRNVRDYFGKLVTIFGKSVTIFTGKLVSRAPKQVLRNLGPLWHPGGLE